MSGHTGEPGMVLHGPRPGDPRHFLLENRLRGDRTHRVAWWHLAPAKGTAWGEGVVSQTKQFFRGEELEQQEKETADGKSVAEVLERPRGSTSQGPWNYGHDHGSTDKG